jgi:hypothetical protein
MPTPGTPQDVSHRVYPPFSERLNNRYTVGNLKRYRPYKVTANKHFTTATVNNFAKFFRLRF